MSYSSATSLAILTYFSSSCSSFLKAKSIILKASAVDPDGAAGSADS
jgi:hypothetical protein